MEEDEALELLRRVLLERDPRGCPGGRSARRWRPPERRWPVGWTP
ncbi:hypothetical protein [Kitasatospora cheerisanensis]|nr:hypothetical protein [Kitasatospora cheerisanensis]